jgi:hypothetical protein
MDARLVPGIRVLEAATRARLATSVRQSRDPHPPIPPHKGEGSAPSPLSRRNQNCGSDWECELWRLLGSVPAERALARESRDPGATRRARDDCVTARANPVAMEISAGGILGELPLPAWGEGWGEGVTDDRETLTPHPTPLPMGEGAHRVRCPSEQDGETDFRNGRKTGRSPARGAGEQVPAGHQLANRQGARPRRASDATCARRRGDRMKRRPMTAVGTERTREASPIMSA